MAIKEWFYAHHDRDHDPDRSQEIGSALKSLSRLEKLAYKRVDQHCGRDASQNSLLLGKFRYVYAAKRSHPQTPTGSHIGRSHLLIGKCFLSPLTQSEDATMG